MMAPHGIIQPFPPGMVAPSKSSGPPPARPVDLPTVSQRRRQVLDELAKLSTHSHKRALLMGRLRELTLAELREGLR